MKVVRFLVLLGLFIIIGLQFRVYLRPSMTGQPAAELFASRWFNSEPLTKRDLHGKVALLDFWAVWCGGCLAELPEVALLYDKYSSRGLLVIGVHDASGKLEEIEQVIREKGIKYPVMRDTDRRETFIGYRIVGIPHLILVGKDGRVLADGEPIEQMEKRIRRELSVP
ncbi:MAG: TlpA disulfide reductase family protein [Armatimonadota bacterium]